MLFLNWGICADCNGLLCFLFFFHTHTMKIIFVTDLHGSEWKYNRLFEVATDSKAHIVINGGDMLPKNGELSQQRDFITSFLDGYFNKFNDAGICYLCYPGNDDLMIFDQLFEEVCRKYHFVVPLAQRKYDINGYEFIGVNWVVDYPFRLKDRCRMDTTDYVFQKQLGTGLLSTQQGFKEVKDWSAYARSLPTLNDELTKLVRPKNMSNAIYVIHMPPARLGLDIHLPLLSTPLRSDAVTFGYRPESVYLKGTSTPPTSHTLRRTHCPN